MLTRRTFVNALAATAATAVLAGCDATENMPETAVPEPTLREPESPAVPATSTAPVYFTREISPEGLARAFDALGFSPAGNVAVKLSTGEPGGHNFLSPDLIGDFVRSLGATIVECNTAYGGARGTTESHLRAAADHGFTAIANVDIMDADGSMSLPVEGGTHLTEDLVGAHLASYDSVVSLAHFKGHAMGGFGGAIKNCSIGIASREGKMLIHSAGTSTTSWGSLAEAIGLGSQTYELVDLDAGTTEEEPMTINVTCNGRTVTYGLNDSAAARGLVGQLPLTLDVEPFGSNEQTFYPPEALDCSDAPLAEGGAGVLAYYEPWGDVVMFYDGFSGNGGLYELGRAVAGAENVAGMAGTIEVTRA